MSMSKIPKLRFKEFSGEWEERKLGSLTTLMQSGLSRLLSDTDIGLPVIRSNNLQNGQLDIRELKYWYSVDNQGANTENYFLQEEDLLVNFINSLAQIGKVAMYKNVLNRNTIFTTNIMRLRFKESANSSFIFNFFHTKKYINYIQSIAKPAVNQASFTTKDLNNLPIFLPQISEQQKIASFLSAIDTKIDQLTRKKELLEQYKKGVMQKIFSQELRFRTDDGSEFTEWEQKTIADCITESKIKGDTGDKAKKLTVKLWNKGVFAKNEIISGSENTQYYIRKAGQFIYSKLDFLNCAFGIIPENLDGYQSTIDLPCFDFINNTNPIFFLSRVSRKDFYLHFGEQADGSRKARRINQNIFLEMPILLPSVDEQTKIANFLSALDTKIDFLTKQLDEAKNFKKGLLQQMFV